MIIGAVVALISGATFSTFTDSAFISGSINAGTVYVNALSGQEDTTFTWSGTSCPGPLNSGASCTSTVNVSYDGTLAATMDIDLSYVEFIEPPESEGQPPSTCFTISAVWSATDGDPAEEALTEGQESLSLTGLTAESGTLSVQVTLIDNDGCQGASVSLFLDITTTEDLPN
jgi:predicted ribosomally synthesized peptide with SipW-like signal peptide